MPAYTGSRLTVEEGVSWSVPHLVDFARHRGRLFKGQLKLDVIPTLGPYLLTKLLPLLHLRHPDLVKLRETQTKALI
jgi:LysR family transcriptional regulator, hydrogen peroxide-inducible genes activator